MSFTVSKSAVAGLVSDGVTPSSPRHDVESSVGRVPPEVLLRTDGREMDASVHPALGSGVVGRQHVAGQQPSGSTLVVATKDPGQEFLATLRRKPLILEPGRTILSVLNQLPHNFSGTLLVGDNQSGQVQIALCTTPHATESGDMKIVIDNHGRRSVFFSYEDEWISMDPTRWPTPLHLCGEENLDYVLDSIFRTLETGDLCFDIRLIPAKSLNQVYQDGKLLVREHITPDVIVNLIAYYRMYQRFKELDRLDAFTEMQALERSLRDEYSNRGVGLERFVRQVSALGITAFRIKVTSDGSLVAKPEESFGKRARGEQDSFRIALNQVAPGIFDVTVYNGFDWVDVDLYRNGGSQASVGNLLDQIFVAGEHEECPPLLTKVIERNKSQLIRVMQLRADYKELEILVRDLESSDKLLEFLLTHPVLADFLLDAAPNERFPAVLQYLGVVMKIYSALFNRPLLDEERKGRVVAVGDNADPHADLLICAMRAYAIEVVKAKLLGRQLWSAATPEFDLADEMEFLEREARLLEPASAAIVAQMRVKIRDLVASSGRDEDKIIAGISAYVDSLFPESFGDEGLAAYA